MEEHSSSQSDPKDSRGWIWIPLTSGQPAVIGTNWSGYGPLPIYFPPSDKNKWTVTKGEDGTITITYDLVVSGPLDTTGAAPHLNGTIVLTPNADGGYDYTIYRDGFPWAEAYYWDGQGNVTTIFQDPARRGNPYDLFAIEPSITSVANTVKTVGTKLFGQPLASQASHRSTHRYRAE